VIKSNKSVYVFMILL